MGIFHDSTEFNAGYGHYRFSYRRDKPDAVAILAFTGLALAGAGGALAIGYFNPELGREILRQTRELIGPPSRRLNQGDMPDEVNSSAGEATEESTNRAGD